MSMQASVRRTERADEGDAIVAPGDSLRARLR